MIQPVDKPIADGATEETHEEYLTGKTEEVRESFRALQRLEGRARETAIDMMRQPGKYTLSGLQALIAPREVTAAEEEVDAIPKEE